MHHRCHGGGAQSRKRIKKREGRELSEQLYNKAPFCYQNTHASITHMHTHMTKWPTLLSFSPAKKAHKTEERERKKKVSGGLLTPLPVTLQCRQHHVLGQEVEDNSRSPHHSSPRERRHNDLSAHQQHFCSGYAARCWHLPRCCTQATACSACFNDRMATPAPASSSTR